MGRFEIGQSKAGINTANSPMWQLKTSSTQRVALLELGCSVEVAPTTGPVFRLVRSTAVGTSSATATPQGEDPATVVATTVVDTAWSVAPTLAATDLRRFAAAAAIGAGVVWTWYDKPLIIPVSAGLAIVNANATGATLGTLSFYAVFDE